MGRGLSIVSQHKSFSHSINRPSPVLHVYIYRKYRIRFGISVGLIIFYLKSPTKKIQKYCKRTRAINKRWLTHAKYIRIDRSGSAIFRSARSCSSRNCSSSSRNYGGNCRMFGPFFAEDSFTEQQIPII